MRVRAFVHERDCVLLNQLPTKGESTADPALVYCKCGWPDEKCLLVEEQEKDKNDDEQGIGT